MSIHMQNRCYKISECQIRMHVCIDGFYCNYIKNVLSRSYRLKFRNYDRGINSTLAL